MANYPSSPPSSTPATHGEVVDEVVALAQYAMRELAYAETRTLFTFANNLTWNEVTGVSASLTAPGGAFYVRAEATATVSHTDKVALFLRIVDVGAAAEVGRGVVSLIDHFGAAAGAAETHYNQVSAQARITGVAAGTVKTYRVEALQITDGGPPTVGLQGDSGSDRNATTLRAWR